MIRKIISGGQTGADQGGLRAGVSLGLLTGGVAPPRFMTATGQNPSLLRDTYGLVEGDADPSVYRLRTIRNVQDSQGTLWVGREASPGGQLTIGTANSLGRPYICNPSIEDLCSWLSSYGIEVLNVAGNREHTNPGIDEATYMLVREALSKMTTVSTTLLPVIESPLSPIWGANRSCEACPLHLTCKGPVPGYGPISTDIMLVGEAPGRKEDEDAIPFKNDMGAGAELTKRLMDNGIDRAFCFISNVVKCRPSSKNRNPTREEIDTCAPTWLTQEIVMVQPRIVVAMGLFATRYITGSEDNMEHLHGIPLENVPVYRSVDCSLCGGLGEVEEVTEETDTYYMDSVTGHITAVFEGVAEVKIVDCKTCEGEGVLKDLIYTIPIVLPIYHPAAGLHNTNLMKQIQKDFAILGGLAAGRSPADYQLIDDYPEPLYQELHEISEVQEYIWEQFTGPYEISMDTETVKDKLWSIQLSRLEGEAVFIRKGLWEAYTADQLERGLPVFPDTQTMYVHNYLYDARILSWDQDKRLGPEIFIDTMVVAYLVGMPLGLKTLARDLAGVLMHSFDDMIRDTRKAAVLDWIGRGIEAGSGRLDCETCEGSGRVTSPTANLTPPAKAKPDWKPRSKNCPDCKGAGSTEIGYPITPPIEFMSWNNREGRLVIKSRSPLNIMLKLRGIIRDQEDSEPEERLAQIDEIELVNVVARIGDLPETSIADVSEEVSVPYACRDADTTLRVAHKIMPLMYETGAASVLYLQDLPILPIVLRMMRNGMKIDVDRFKEISLELMHKLGFSSVSAAQKAGDMIYGGLHPGDAPEYGFNPNSTHQVAQVLYELTSWPANSREQKAMLKPGTQKLQPTKYTDTGLPSTADKELQKIKSVFPHAAGLVTDITDYREYLKLKSTYADPLPLKIGEDGRLHTSFLTVNTETGRLASRDPNLMNIPVRSEMGKRIRYAFVCECGFSFLAIDYSQIEMRVVMHISGCVRGIQLFRDGRDLHTETAATIFGVSLDEAGKDQYRFPVKRLGFGVIYGITEYGLSDLMIQEGVEGWDRQRCRAFIKDYFKIFPEIEQFQKWTKAFVKEMGYVEDIFGRRRYIPEVTSAVPKVIAMGERMAINMPVQSGAQGIIKRAMVVVNEEIQKRPEWEGKIYDIIQNHDELIWEVDDSILEEAAVVIHEKMESVVSLSIPVTCDIEIGKDWGSLKKWKPSMEAVGV